MRDWTAGYVADIEYTVGFYREQSPGHLNLACLLGGFEGVPVESGFSYCELGCGQGFTATLLAAANPRGVFHAVDFNPAHIARARALAAEAAIPNIRFHETSFDELANAASPDLPEFDFVTLHGVYSWVSEENRRAIVRFLRRHLKPGGIAYVSYNCMPGWAQALPVQRLLYECATLAADRSDRQIARAVALVEQLREVKARSLQDNPFLDDILRMAKLEQLRYLVHEYLNGSWRPLYHIEVARELTEAKLDFAASANLLDGFPELNLTPPQRELLSQFGAAELGETLKDYCVGRRFRKDVFLRGSRHLSRARQDALLRRTRLALAVARSDAELTLSVPLGEASLEPRVYGRMLDALAEAPLTVSELLDLPEIRGTTEATPREIVGMLVGSNQALPVLPEVDPEAAAAVKRFNRAVARQAQEAETNSRLALAAAPLGTGLYAGVVEMVTYLGVASGAGTRPDELAPLIWEPIRARGEKLLNKEGEPVEGETDSLALIRQQIANILDHRLPVWQRFGAI